MTDDVLALDIGGTKLAAALVGPDGAPVRIRRCATPTGDPERIWDAVEALLIDVLAGTSHPPVAVGVAAPGPIDQGHGTVSPINMAWRDFPLTARVADATGLPVTLAGDGVCMAFGETRFGAARGARFVLGFVVSTGVGGGLVLDGRPVLGRTGNAGHIGHVVVEPDGLPCTCGGRGCVETIASGPNLVRWARAHGWQAHPDADARVLAEAARAGDDIAVRAFRRAGDALARMIASVAAVADLEVAVVGGGVAQSGSVLFEPLRDGLDRYAGLDFIRDVQVVPAELGVDAGLVGAAELVRRFG